MNLKSVKFDVRSFCIYEINQEVDANVSHFVRVYTDWQSPMIEVIGLLIYYYVMRPLRR